MYSYSLLLNSECKQFGLSYNVTGKLMFDTFGVMLLYNIVEHDV